VWKKTGLVFHGVEKNAGNFPRCGKYFSTVWKTVAVLAVSFSAISARAESPAPLALALDAEGRREAAAIEFRRLALAEAQAESAGSWYWLAAHQYAMGRSWELSNRMLDRAEDAAPFALSVPVSWLRAENALQERDWSSAAFHFDSLQRKADADDWRGFSARGAAAARLREKDISAARQALATAPADPADARAAIDRYAGKRDKKPWVGGVLGLVPGLGYVYSGEYANAARSLILNSLFIWGMVEAAESEEWGLFAVVTFGELTWYTGSIYGGIDAAHRHNQRRLDAAVSDVRGSHRPAPDLSQVPVVTLRFEF
jgi:tetratricopeptide (TPR) repeat protein